MRANDRAFAVRDLHNVLGNTDVGVWVKRWLHCSVPGISVSHFYGSEPDCPFVRCYEGIEYEKDLSMLVLRFDGQPLPKLVHRLSPYVVRLVTYILPNALNTGRMAGAYLSFVCVIMQGVFSLARAMSSCLSSQRRVGQVITWGPRLVVRVKSASLALCSDTSGHCILLRLYFETSSPSGFGVVHCDF